jgi:hypothetical protein
MRTRNRRIARHAELRRIVDVIAREQRRRAFEAIRSLWRTGDAVGRLKQLSEKRDWRRTLRWCAERVHMHPSSLDDAARAAAAFRRSDRRALLHCFERANARLTVSHVVELARASPKQRAEGVNALLRETHSIRKLRGTLRRNDM